MRTGYWESYEKRFSERSGENVGIQYLHIPGPGSLLSCLEHCVKYRGDGGNGKEMEEPVHGALLCFVFNALYCPFNVHRVHHTDWIYKEYALVFAELHHPIVSPELCCIEIPEQKTKKEALIWAEKMILN